LSFPLSRTVSQRGTGGTIEELKATTPRLIPLLPVRLADGRPPWAVPGGHLDITEANRWEAPADPTPQEKPDESAGADDSGVSVLAFTAG
jgi:hypothetical protein